MSNCVSSVLDISQTETFPDQGVYKEENKILALIVKCLPNLMSLDISGTNLAGKGKLSTYFCFWCNLFIMYVLIL